jgi:hypothetical protein
MTQTQETTPEPKESKAKSFLVNTLTFKSDPIFLTLEIRPEADWVGKALSLASWLSWLRPPLPMCFLGYVAAWAWKLERKQREGRREREREGADTWQLRKRVSSYQV